MPGGTNGGRVAAPLGVRAAAEGRAVVPAGVLAADQARQLANDARPAGVRVLREDCLPMGPWDGSSGLEPGHVPAELVLQKEQRIAIAAALRATGYSAAQISAHLKVSLTTVRLYLAKAREWGALEDVMRDIEHRAVPAAVENLLKGLEDGDKDYTLKTLEGRGVFRTFSNQKHEGGPAPAMQLAVTFVNAPAQPVTGAFVSNTLHGQVIGQPRE